MTWTPMESLRELIKLIYVSLGDSSASSRKQMFMDILRKCLILL